MLPATAGFAQCVCGDDELLHDDGDDDHGGLSGDDELLVIGFNALIADENWPGRGMSFR